MASVLVVFNPVADNLLPVTPHATRTSEHSVSKTTVKLALCQIGRSYRFFFLLCNVCSASAPTVTKATVYFISLATKACDQSFIIYDAANGLGPIKTDICITQGLR